MTTLLLAVALSVLIGLSLGLLGGGGSMLTVPILIYALKAALINCEQWAASPRAPSVGRGAYHQQILITRFRSLDQFEQRRKDPPARVSGRGRGGGRSYKGRWFIILCSEDGAKTLEDGERCL